MEETLLDKIVHVLGEPFSSWSAFLGQVRLIPWPLTSLRSQTGWLYLLSSLVIGYVVYRSLRRRGEIPAETSFAETVFPKAIYLHRSAIMDYKFVLLDKSIRLFLYVPLFSAVGYETYQLCLALLGPSSFTLPGNLAVWVLPTYAVVVADFSLFIAHRLMHRVPFLWPFHEVHHSAEVLTPATSYRIHPIEELVTTGIQSTVAAVSAAFFTSVSDIPVSPLSLFGVNALTFGFYLFGFQLRHSHVWLSYGPVWSRIFISPAQHQIHHSEARKHWDKNFGFVFAVWDRLFGTLYIPKEREQLTFGCGADPEDYSTLTRMYFTPFKGAWKAVRASVGRAAPARVTTPDPTVISPHATTDSQTTERTPLGV